MTTTANTMRAVRYHPPGGPEKLLAATESRPPALKPNEALIKVSAVALIHTELTWPIYQNPDGSYKTHIPGHDFSGTIVDIKYPNTIDESNTDEESAHRLKVGSEVYAFTSRRNHEGALAEYAVADLDQVLPKPRNMSMTEAASVPLSALTAWQALFDHGSLGAGQRVLITGVGGGTGIWAVQFAKRVGAHVTGTGGSERSREVFKMAGGDDFVDYHHSELSGIEAEFDLVLDCVGGDVTGECFGLAKKDALVISICTWDCAEQASKRGARGLFFIVSMKQEQLGVITELIEKGEVKTVVDRVFPLESARNAFEYAAKGHVHGKVVIEVEKEVAH